jgi:hypothetical protein
VNEVVALSTVGCVTVVDAVVVQPFASVIVTVYVPAVSALALAPVPPLGDQLYVYGATPPFAVTDAEPELPPKHRTGDEVAVAESAVG